MIVSCCIKGIHVGSCTGVVLHKLFEIFNVINLCTVTVHQPSFVIIIKSCPWERYLIFRINLIYFTPICDMTEYWSSMSLLNQVFKCLLIFYFDYLQPRFKFYFLSIYKVVFSLNFLFVKILCVCMNGG